jgi:hypothetical protein
MVVDYLSMSSVNFAIPDFCSVIPVGSLRQSRRVGNRRVTHRPCLVMESRLIESDRDCSRLRCKTEVIQTASRRTDEMERGGTYGIAGKPGVFSIHLSESMRYFGRRVVSVGLQNERPFRTINLQWIEQWGLFRPSSTSWNQ